ncbi:MAG: ABC transporter permease [Nocardioides sp.]
MAKNVGLWVRWSWRDLRRRWTAVAAIAAVIALGTGTYAGLLSTSAWRTQSNDASFALLDVHDLRAALPSGSTTSEGHLLEIAAGLPHAGDVLGARERLVLPTQVAGPDGLLVPGELVGTDTRAGPGVDGVHIDAGRALTPANDGARSVVADLAFADANDLALGTELTVSGGAELEVVGRGQSPEYFILTGGQGGLPFLTQKAYAVLFTSLHTVQEVTGTPGQVNDIVLTIRPGADRDLLRRELEQALATGQQPLAADVTTRDEIDAYRVLYDDIEGDQQLWRVIALLVLLGAAFAAMNLTTRIVEAQRREIGIGMALGVPARLLAVRPLLFGAQIALLGVGLGLVAGWAISIPLREVFVGMIPLPVWHTPMQADVFAQAAALGFVLPFVAIAWPVWQALRVQPVEAIRVGHLAARAGGLAPVLRRLRLPGRGYWQIPLRNVFRTPRRSALTALGIAAAITTLVTTVGLLDTFSAALGRAEDETLHAAPDRVSVSLDTFQPIDGKVIQAVEALPETGAVEPGLRLPGEAETAAGSVELIIDLLPERAAWQPTLSAGSRTDGLVLADKAAKDLDVGIGDTVTVEHPQASPTGLQTVRSKLPVVGIHPNPMRMFAYLDPGLAQKFGLAGTANTLSVTPADGMSAEQVRRALLGVPHVALAQTPQAAIEGMRATLDEFVGILNVAALITLLLALLIAFNTTSIAVDERSREHATMLAFGLPVRSVLGLTGLETVLVGALGTMIGIAGGYGVLRWMSATTIAEVMPEIGVSATVAGATVVQALALGVLTVALAPLLTVRRLRRTDIPSALRVME